MGDPRTAWLIITVFAIVTLVYTVGLIWRLQDIHERLRIGKSRKTDYANRRELRRDVAKAFMWPLVFVAKPVKDVVDVYAQLPEPDNPKKLTDPADPLKGHVEVVRDE